VSCTFSREALALHVEGDLPERYAEITASHLATCEGCRGFFEELRTRQTLLKSLRRETVDPGECAGMRREVMSILSEQPVGAGWALRIERAIVLCFRQRAYALAAVVVLGILSASLLAQIRLAVPETNQSVAVFEDKDTLIRPEGYRNWVLVGPSHNVYVNPSGYRAYARTGRFPEGTLMVWESVNRSADNIDHPHKGSPVLLASVRDSTRFDGGWGFFDFTGDAGTVMSKAPALPESSGCRQCHPQI
jgi:hypothetical protein